jgi:predicted molibdopterin-dependent oxidoreductase YjgC
VGTPHLDYRVDGSHGKTALMHDDILRRQDPHPNNTGCAALGAVPGPGGAGVEAILDACLAGTVRVLHLMAADVLTARHDVARVRDALSKVPFVVVHAYHNVPGLTDLAHVVLADASYLEQGGTFVNAQGRVQRFNAAHPPPGRARTASSVLAQLAARLGASLPDGPASALFVAMAEAEPAFSGLTWNGLGKHGQPLPSPQPQAVGS